MGFREGLLEGLRGKSDKPKKKRKKQRNPPLTQKEILSLRKIAREKR